MLGRAAESLVDWLHGGSEVSRRDGRPAVSRYSSDPLRLESACDVYVEYVEVEDSLEALDLRGSAAREAPSKRRFVVLEDVPVYGERCVERGSTSGASSDGLSPPRKFDQISTSTSRVFIL